MNKLFKRISKALVLGMLIGNTAQASCVYGDEVKKASIEEKQFIEKQVTIGNLQYTISGLELTEVFRNWKASDGNEFLKVDLKIYNVGDERDFFYPFMNLMMKAKNSDEHFNIMMPQFKRNIVGYIEPNEEREIQLYYNIKKSISEYEVIFRNIKDDKNKLYIDTAKLEAICINDDKENIPKDEEKEQWKKQWKFEIDAEEELQNFKYVIDGVRTRNYIGDEKVEEGYRLLDIYMIAENIGSYQDQITSSFVFMLKDGDKEYQKVVMPEEDGLNGIVDKWKKVKGRLTFKVREDSKEFKLRIKPNPWNKYEKVIEIKLD